MMGIWWSNINSDINSNTIASLKQHAFHATFLIYAQPKIKRISDPIEWTDPQTLDSTAGRRIGRDVFWIRIYGQSYKSSPVSPLDHHYQQDPLELPHRRLITDNMPSARSSPIPRKEFIEVITNSDLTPTLTPPSHKFSSILTKTSLLNTKTPISPIPHIDLIKYYNQMFPTIDSYKNFMDCQLGIWEHDLQVKYFDSLHCHQQSTTISIKTLCDQVQKLLEEANQLQEKKHSLWQEIDHHLHTIIQPELHQHLYNPYKVYPQLPVPTARPTQLILHSNPNPRKQTVLRCFQCNSLTHIKWNCPQYCCQYCGDMAPGHSQ